MPAPRVCGTPAHGHLRGPHTGGTIRTGPLGFSGGAEHAKSGPRGPWAVTGSLCRRKGGQAFSVSQRSLPKESVTQGRLSRSQCLGTLCLKGEEGRRAKRKKKGRSFLVFLRFSGVIKHRGFAVERTSTGTHVRRTLAFAPHSPEEPDSKPRDLLEGHLSEKQAYYLRYLDPDSGGPFSNGAEQDTPQPLTDTRRQGTDLVPRASVPVISAATEAESRGQPPASRRQASSSRTRSSGFHPATGGRRVPASEPAPRFQHGRHGFVQEASRTQRVPGATHGAAWVPSPVTLDFPV